MLDQIIPQVSLRYLTRPVPSLTEADSVQRFLQVSRQSGCTSLPLLSRDRPVGTVRYQEVESWLNGHTGVARPAPKSSGTVDDFSRLEALLMEPIRSVLQPNNTLIPATATLAEARATFQQANLGLLDALPVCDENGHCVGMVVYQDLLVQQQTTEFAHPTRIGGMATPMGVYLTDGVWQGGASNIALVGTGMVTGILLMVSGYAAQFGWHALTQHTTVSGPLKNLDIAEFNTNLPLPIALITAGIKLTIYLIFFLLLRSTSIAGYHAAEHQTVHALERNEPLRIEVVRRMPRPHPRCGTNLMAALLLVFTVAPLIGSAFHLAVEDAILLGSLLTLFSYRRLGTFLQETFTTRPASDKQLASGIIAAKSLLETYYRQPPTRTRWLRRIWCMGLIQNMIGLLLVVGTQELLIWAFGRMTQH